LGGALAAPASALLDARTAPVSAAVLGWIALAAASGLAAYAGLFHAFARAKLSLAIPFVSCWALVAGAFSVLVLGERPQALQLAGAGIIFAGVLLVARGAAGDAPTAAAGAGARRALLVALGAGVAFGLMVPSMSQAAPALGAFGTIAAVYAAGMALAWPAARLVGADLRPPPRASWVLVLATGVCETAGYVTLTLAGRFAPLAVIAPVASLASAFTVLAAWLFLHERPPRVALVGALLASAGIVLLSRMR